MEALNYKLTEEQNNDIFENYIKPITSEVISQPKPVVHIVGGQTGAGKSRLVHDLGIENEAVIASLDNLREFNPLSYSAYIDYPEYYSDLTKPDATIWREKLIDTCIGNNKNVVIEHTFANLDNLTELIDKFKTSGYDVALHLVAVPSIVSRLGSIIRYAQVLKLGGVARYVPKNVHDKIYHRIPTNIVSLLQDKKVQKFSAHARNGSIIPLGDIDHISEIDIEDARLLSGEYSHEDINLEQYKDKVIESINVIRKSKNEIAYKEAIDLIEDLEYLIRNEVNK